MGFSGIHWVAWLAWLLAIFFVANGLFHAFPPQRLRERFRISLARWGYPIWFYQFNGALQTVCGVLLVVPPTRLIGIAIGFVVCLGVFYTLARDGGYARLGPNTVLFGLICLLAWGAIAVPGAS